MRRITSTARLLLHLLVAILVTALQMPMAMAAGRCEVNLPEPCLSPQRGEPGTLVTVNRPTFRVVWNEPRGNAVGFQFRPDQDRILLAEVEDGSFQEGLTFVVPDVPPGRYEVVIYDEAAYWWDRFTVTGAHSTGALWLWWGLSLAGLTGAFVIWSRTRDWRDRDTPRSTDPDYKRMLQQNAGGRIALLAAVSAGLWLATLAFLWLSGLGLGPPGAGSGIVGFVGMAASVLLLSTLLGITWYQQDIRPADSVGLVASVLGVAGMVLWVAVGDSTLLTIAAILLVFGVSLVAGSMLARGVLPRHVALTLGGGLAIGGLVFVLVRAIEQTFDVIFGRRVFFGDYDAVFGTDYWISIMLGFSVGTIILSRGLLGLARWLRYQGPARSIRA